MYGYPHPQVYFDVTDESGGRLEGNTLVVQAIGFDHRTWLDHNGYPHSDQMRLQERYRLLDADTLELTMTLIRDGGVGKN